MYTFKHKYRIYCGPCIVKETAEKLSRNYLAVEAIGTEHVYVETNYDRDHVLGILGPTWKHSDIVDLRSK